MTSNLNMLRLLLFLLLSNLCSRINGELFTAIYEIEHLLETHKRIINDLDHYIEQEEARIGELKKQISHFKREHEKAMEDIPNYLGNPINAFTLIKRLTSDLDLMEDRINIGTEYIKNITMSHKDLKYPTSEDLYGAAQALTRLQKTYSLKTEEVAEGFLNKVKYSTPLTASDCYVLGKALYNQNELENSLEWMMVALKKYEESDEKYDFTDVDILEYISFAHYLLDRPRPALEWTKKLLKLSPNHPRARGNVPHFQKLIDEEELEQKKLQRGDTGDPEQDYVAEEITTKEKLTEAQMYAALCRGEMEIAPEISKKLKCWYTSENHPFLKYAPLKVEQAYIQPDIYIFHEVMSDNEIETIKEMAIPRFKRAVVHDPKSGKLVSAHYRISKSSWLRDEESPTVARVSRRVAHMTGLSMATAEELQVVNYGIGGHYEPHFDFARNTELRFSQFSGNRMATVLFYMSDVAQGGATVFTELGLSLFPIKGAAAFWWNLHTSGEGDHATRHAACPVLRGSKWVSNKWIHLGGQEFNRPCGLEYHAEGLARQPLPPQPATAR